MLHLPEFENSFANITVFAANVCGYGDLLWDFKCEILKLLEKYSKWLQIVVAFLNYKDYYSMENEYV